LVVSAGWPPPAIWCSSPPATGWEFPLEGGPFRGLRFPGLVVVVFLFMIFVRFDFLRVVKGLFADEHASMGLPF